MKRVVFTRSSLVAAAFLTGGHVFAADLAVPSVDYPTLQAAVLAAQNDDRIMLADGTYVLGTTLQVNKSITIEGETQAGTVINASATGLGWGINVAASDVTLKNLTVLPPVGPGTRGTNQGGGFAIHAAYDTTAVTARDGLTLQDITIDDSNRTAFDIHGFDNVTLSGLTATDAAYGNGIQLSGCTNVTITGCTTSGNAWGGIAVYASKASDLNRPSSAINFDFAANNVAEYFYIETEQGLVSTANVTGTTYQIDNAYGPPSAAMAYYTNGDLTKATSLAQGLNAKYSNSASVLADSNGSTLILPGLSLQAAIDAATPGDTLTLNGAITLTSPVTLNKQLTLDGGDKTSTQISGSNALAGRFITTLGSSGGSIIKNISFIKTDKAGVQNLIGLQTPNVVVEDCSFSGQYVLGDPDVSRAFEISGSGSGFHIENCSFTGLRQPAYINNVSSGSVLNNYAAGTRGWVVDGGLVDFTGNTWSGNAVDIALLDGTPASPLYDPLSALSARNSGAVISNQRSAQRVSNTTKGVLYLTIQAAINAADNGDALEVYPGTFNEDVVLSKDVTLQGAGAGISTISGPIGGVGAATIQITASGATVDGFTITRDGNNPTDWNNPALNSPGIAIQGTSITGVQISNNQIVGNRSGIDINNSNGHTVRNNVITNNHTGLIFRNQTDGITLTENSVVNNRTVGVLFLDASGGSNVPVQTALGGSFSNNDISGNWYGQVVDRQAGGALLAPGANLKNFERNWLGSDEPVVTTANSAEPGYSSLIPASFGGTATPPAVAPHIAGPASANIDFGPYLADGTDTNVETSPNRGTYGFQGDLGEAIETVIGNTTISGSQTFGDLFIPAGTTISVTPGGTLIATTLTLGPGASLVVNGGELILGEDSKISGTFTIFNSFGSFDINGDTTFDISQSLALVTDIHIAAGAVVTVNGGGELILDGCVIDSQTPATPYTITTAADGLLTMARCVVSDANIDINTSNGAVAANLKSKVYDNTFTASDIEASADAQVYHNIFDGPTNTAANTDATAAFANVDGWGNVTSAAGLRNTFGLEMASPLAAGRTLDAGGNLYVQPGDTVVMSMDVAKLDPNGITAAEALLGYNSGLLDPVGASGVVPAANWDVLVESAPTPTGSLGLIDSALGLEFTYPDPGITADSNIANVSFTALAPGLTLGFFRVQTDRGPDAFDGNGQLVKDTRLTNFQAPGTFTLYSPYTSNTGEVVIDNEVPTLNTLSSGTQVQPTVGSVNVLLPTTNYVIRDGVTPVTVTFTADDNGLAGLDTTTGVDGYNSDLTLTASGPGTTLNSSDYTVVASGDPNGVVTYTVTLNVPVTANTGTYSVAATLRDRSGNLTPAPVVLGSFQIANEVLATVELQSFVGTGPGTLRTVTFVATGGTPKTWTKPVAFTGGSGTVALEDVPAGTTSISAKTEWTLRNKLAVPFSGTGVGTASFTGSERPKAGDLNGDNVINTLDYSLLRFNWLTVNAVADISGDGVVNTDDYAPLQANFFTVGKPQ